MKIYCRIRTLNYIVKHLIEILHQNLQLKDLLDKGCHGDFGNARKKCLIVSISVPQLHVGLTQPLNFWQNLCLFKWLHFSCSLLSNFTPIWSCIENSYLCSDLKNCVNIDMNSLLDLAPRMEFLKLFGFLTQTGKKKYFQLSVL